MDALSEMLRSISLQYCHIGTLHLSEPGSIRWNARSQIAPSASCFSLLGGGPVWVIEQGGTPVKLNRGDTFFATRYAKFVLTSSLNAEPIDVAALWAKLKIPAPSSHSEPDAPLQASWGGGDHESAMLSIAFGLPSSFENLLLTGLPALTVFRFEEERDSPWIAPAIAFLARESADTRPGFAAAARALAELVFVSFVRTLVSRAGEARRGWLRGLLDPKIAPALSAMHRDPAKTWTVASLAAESGMSRTAFALRFAELVERSPIDYLTCWRMELARQRLDRGHANVGELAMQLGYGSEAAFRQAFKRHHAGAAPTRFAGRQAHAGAHASR